MRCVLCGLPTSDRLAQHADLYGCVRAIGKAVAGLLEQPAPPLAHVGDDDLAEVMATVSALVPLVDELLDEREARHADV